MPRALPAVRPDLPETLRSLLSFSLAVSAGIIGLLRVASNTPLLPPRTAPAPETRSFSQQLKRVSKSASPFRSERACAAWEPKAKGKSTCQVACACVIGKVFTPASFVHGCFFTEQELWLAWQLIDAPQHPGIHCSVEAFIGIVESAFFRA